MKSQEVRSAGPTLGDGLHSEFYPHCVDDFAEEHRIHKFPFVYVIASLDLLYMKIGRATSFKTRFSAIQCGCPHKLFLWRGIRTPNHIQVESYIHERLSHARLRGEWFSLSDEDLDWLDQFIALTNKEIVEKSRIAKGQFGLLSREVA